MQAIIGEEGFQNFLGSSLNYLCNEEGGPTLGFNYIEHKERKVHFLCGPRQELREEYVLPNIPLIKKKIDPESVCCWNILLRDHIALLRASLVAQMVKNPCAMQETQV